MPNQWPASYDVNPVNIQDAFASEEFFQDPDADNNKKALLRVSFRGDLGSRWFVIVETWDHKNYGRGKRSYKQLFTEKERRQIARWYKHIYNWYLRTGLPRRFTMSLETFNLLDRAANFFATI